MAVQARLAANAEVTAAGEDLERLRQQQLLEDPQLDEIALLPNLTQEAVITNEI